MKPTVRTWLTSTVLLAATTICMGSIVLQDALDGKMEVRGALAIAGVLLGMLATGMCLGRTMRENRRLQDDD